ncbi:unnamed protein product, partial [Rotaria sp. Silwood1]
MRRVTCKATFSEVFIYASLAYSAFINDTQVGI